MIASLSQISTPVWVGGLFALVVINTIFMKWFLGKIESEPADEPDSDEVAEGTGALVPESVAVRTTAGVPRSRPIQPVEPASTVGNPSQSTTLSGSSAAPAPMPVAPPAAAEPASAYAPKPAIPTPEKAIAPAPVSLAKMSSPAETPHASVPALPLDKPAAAAVKAEPVKPETPKADEPSVRADAPLSPTFPSPEKRAESGTSPTLPSSNFTKELSNPAAISEKSPLVGGDLIARPNVPAQPVKPLESKPTPAAPSVLSTSASTAPSASLISVDKPAQPLASMPPPSSEVAPAKSESTTPLAKDMPPSVTKESSTPSRSDLIAIPASVASAKRPEEEKAAEGSKSASTGANPVGSGLILNPSSPEASPVTSEPEKSAAAANAAAPSSWKSRLLGRPRIFLPSGGSSTATSETAPVKDEAAETVGEGSLKERFAEPKSEVAAATNPPEAAKPTEEKADAKVEADIPAPAPISATVTEAKTSTAETPLATKPPEEKKADETPVILTSSGDAKSGAKLGEVAKSESVVTPKSEPPIAKVEPPPAPEETKPSADLAPATEVASIIKQVEPVPKPDAEKALPVIAPTAQVLPAGVSPSSKSPVATPAAPIKADAPFAKAVTAPNLPAPIRSAEPVMNQKESTAVLPSGGRASAQITLGFEITSLQLTPFFKLGAVQLRSLSNIVSLHLIASQSAENPLAAGISFQIETVDLDESSHIKSILLKPLGQSTPTATPQPKLQVENVKLGTGNEGAIEITSSQQTSTAVQMLATFTIAAMDFTPSFEIGSLRLEPNSNTVMLRLAPSSKPTALDLPPSFEVSTVSLEGSAQLANVRLVPSGSK